MRNLILLSLLFSSVSWAVVSTQSSMTQFSNNGVVTNVSPSNPLPVTGGGGGGNTSPITVNQGNAGLSSWPVTVTGGATSALQLLGNSTLLNIATNTNGIALSSLQTTGNTSLASILADMTNGTQTTQVTNFPAGTATSANQLTEITNLSKIVTNTGISTVNSSGFSQSGTVNTAISIAPPLGAVGFILMNMDTSNANVRWSIGNVATTASGQQLQPGRSSDYVSVNSAVSLIAESGTQNYSIQWIIK